LKQFLFLFIIFFAVSVSGDALKPEIEKPVVYVGENITITVNVKPGNEMEAFFQTEPEKIAVIDVSSKDKNSTVINLVPIDSGEIDVPELSLIIDGTNNKIEPFSITVKNRTDESDTNLRDIKGTVKIFEKDYSLLYIAGTLLLLSLIIFLLVKYLKKRKKIIESLPVKISPFEIAQNYIKRAQQKRKKGDYEAFVDLITIGLKDYMSLKQKTNYKEMTTFEVKKYLRQDALFAAGSNDILTLLKLGDRFKFADEELSDNDFDILINGFKSIVESAEKRGDENVSA
jgi:hypothetical protein